MSARHVDVLLLERRRDEVLSKVRRRYPAARIIGMQPGESEGAGLGVD